MASARTSARSIDCLVTAAGSRWERRGVDGSGGDWPTRRINNILIALGVSVGFESFHPSQIRRHEPLVALECGSRPEPRREG